MLPGEAFLFRISGVGRRAVLRMRGHGLVPSTKGEAMAAMGEAFELTTTERRARVAELLASGLVRLIRRGTLATSGAGGTRTSLTDSGGSGESRLESSRDTGLTVVGG